jgi:hypothetical protein
MNCTTAETETQGGEDDHKDQDWSTSEWNDSDTNDDSSSATDYNNFTKIVRISANSAICDTQITDHVNIDGFGYSERGTSK